MSWLPTRSYISGIVTDVARPFMNIGILDTMSKPFVISFAGVPGASKTPIAFELSCKFQLPILQRDAIRMEVREDLRVPNLEDEAAFREFDTRADHRFQSLLKHNVCFISDSSADRSWEEQVHTQLQEHGYDYFIISIDLSKDFVQQLYEANHSGSASDLEHYYAQHEKFLSGYTENIGVHITDKDFAERMSICTRAVKVFLADRGFRYTTV
jgi:hypothetical protein